MKKLLICLTLCTLLTDLSYGMKHDISLYEQQNIKDLCKQGQELFNKKEYDKAFKYVEKAALCGHADANTMLGSMYFYGYGCAKDYDSAFQYTKIGEEYGSLIAAINMGYLYHYGYGCQKNFLKAKEYYEKALYRGRNDVLERLGDLYYEDGDYADYNEAFYYYKQSAELNFPKSIYKLGNMYYHGDGCEENPKMALECYEKALQNGCKLALRGLGNFYYTKKYGEQNPEKAFYYYEQASNLGDPVSTKYIADAYYDGEWPYYENIDIAFEYYKRAADLGNDIAMTITGEMLCNGDGCDEDCTEGLKYLDKAIAAGEKAEAPRIAGLLFYGGEDGVRYYSKALEYFKITIEEGEDDGRCAYYAGRCYFAMGNRLEAYRYLRQALNKENKEYAEKARKRLVKDLGFDGYRL